jgi:hypothetical protein
MTDLLLICVYGLLVLSTGKSCHLAGRRAIIRIREMLLLSRCGVFALYTITGGAQDVFSAKRANNITRKNK